MANIPALSKAGLSARAHDPDRFLMTLFAPAARREALFLLIAFNHELVRAIEMPSSRSDAGPIAALIRLQWWREVVEGAARRHELAEPLGSAIQAGALDRSDLLGIIEAREAEAEGVESLQAWRDVQLGGAGGMQVAAGRSLGVSDCFLLDRLRAAGAAYAAGAMHRSLEAMRRSGRDPVPAAVLHQTGSQAETILQQAGSEWLAQAGRLRLGRGQVAAALPAVLARRDLVPTGRSGARGVADRLALVSAWLRGAP